MEAACELKENKILHPFAFRTHTHSLGKYNSNALILHTLLHLQIAAHMKSVNQ